MALLIVLAAAALVGLVGGLLAYAAGWDDDYPEVS
ncbi:hypothetical protein EDC02_6349 [Micromonospora sp. Llam0]|nr:hypothetical protein EDC02_6349 [Micromonospora sp. Llam0]